MTRHSSKRTLNQAVGKLKNQANNLGLGAAVVSKAASGTVYLTFARLCIRVSNHPGRIGSSHVWVDPKCDSSMKSAIEELRKAAGKAPAK